MRNAIMLSLGSLTLLLSGLVGGCAPAGYEMKVALDPHFAESLGDDRVFVHLVPVSPLNRAQWEATPAKEYWMYGASTQPRQLVRAKDTLIFELSAAQPNASLSAGDPHWSSWHADGSTELMVMSSLPLPEKRAEGAPSEPRLFIPAIPSTWSADGVEVVIRSEGIKVTPAVKSQ